MALYWHLDGSTLVIRSVGDQSPAEGLRQLQAGLDLARDHHERTGVRCTLLIDLRESTENRNPAELRDVATLLARDLGHLTGRIAVIATRGLLFGLARMFAVYGEQVGLVTMVFTTDAEALAWLRRTGAGSASETA